MGVTQQNTEIQQISLKFSGGNPKNHLFIIVSFYLILEIFRTYMNHSARWFFTPNLPYSPHENPMKTHEIPCCETVETRGPKNLSLKPRQRGLDWSWMNN